MASDNLTFEIDGEVHLEDLTDSLARFQWLTPLPRKSARQVSHIEFLPETSQGSYRNARGVIPFGPEDPSPEDLIRRLRDS